jgi:hypothetical protein
MYELTITCSQVMQEASELLRSFRAIPTEEAETVSEPSQSALYVAKLILMCTQDRSKSMAKPSSPTVGASKA